MKEIACREHYEREYEIICTRLYLFLIFDI